MRIWVVLLILLAGMCAKTMADGHEDNNGCHIDRQCIDHHCDYDETPYCRLYIHNSHENNSYSHSSCHCRATTHSVGTHNSSDCKQHSDCASHACPNDRPIPYCHHDHLLVIDLGRHCHCMAPTCSEDKDCTCPAGTIPQCNYNFLSRSGSCHCSPIITSTSTDGTTTAGTTTPAPTTRRTTTRAPRTSVVSTTTSVPASMSPLSTSGCHYHSDCSGHLCPPEKHPYCKIDRFSSTCHCTDCIEHKDCFCPQGLVGQCHFDYIHNSHSCVCGLIPDTTTIVPTSTTKSTPVQTMSTTTKSTPIKTTTTTQSSSTQPTTITSTLPSTPKSTTRVASTASSTVDSSSYTPTSTTPTAFSSTKSGTTIKTSTATTTETTTTTEGRVTSNGLNAKISATIFTMGMQCPTCDEALHCEWNQTCYPEENCMIRHYPGTKFTTHCSRKEDCSFMKYVLPNGEIFCCSNRECLRSYLGI